MISILLPFLAFLVGLILLFILLVPKSGALLELAKAMLWVGLFFTLQAVAHHVLKM